MLHEEQQVTQAREEVTHKKRTVYLTVRITEEEKELVESLAEYLYKLKKIPEPTVSNAVRLCIYFTVNEILRAIEAERLGKR